MKTFIFLGLFSMAACVIVLKDVKISTNPDYLAVNVTFTTAPKPLVFSLYINFTGDQCDNILTHAKMFIQGDDKDEKFHKEFMRFTIDARKALNGEMGTSFISQTIETGLAEAADFELKLPYKKGIYKINNLTVTDQYISFLKTKDILMDFRIVGQVKKNSKAMVFLMNVKASVTVM